MSSGTRELENDYAVPGFWSEKPEAWHDFIPGVRRRILTATSACTVTLYKLKGGSNVPLHSHHQAQYGLCLEGGGMFTVGDKSWKLKKGDSYYIPPSVTHGLKIDADGETTLVEVFTPIRRDMLKETMPPDGP